MATNFNFNTSPFGFSNNFQPSNPMMQGFPIFGQEDLEEPIFNPEDSLMGGLGLTGAAFASQTGRLPATMPRGSLSPFAQQIAANDAARLAAQNRPVMIGTGASTSGVTNPRLVPGTNIVPTGQAPVTTGSTSMNAPRGTPSSSSFDYTVNRGTPPTSLSKLAKVGGPLAFLYGIADAATEAITDKGISERIGEFGGDVVGNVLYPGATSQPAFTEDELQRSINNLSTPAQLDILYEDTVSDLDPQLSIADREANISNNLSTLATGINELGTVSDDQRAVQEFLNERAERSGTTATDVVTPFQDQAQLTANLFTDPSTALGQFVPRATFTLPDGTIIQEDQGGNRRQISAEQLRSFEQDMNTIGQDSVLGLGRGGDAGVVKSFDLPMGEEETKARLQELPSGVPTIREIQEQDAKRAGRMTQQETDKAFDDASEKREKRLKQRDRLEGETATERDTRLAQNRTQGSNRGEGTLSFNEARKFVPKRFDSRGNPEPAKAYNERVRAYAQGEADRNLERRKLEASLKSLEARTELMDLQLKSAGIVPVEDPVLNPETGVFMQLYSDGVRRIKGNARSPSPSASDIDALLSDVVPTDTADVPPTEKAIQYLINNPDTAAQFDATYGIGQAEKILENQ